MEREPNTASPPPPSLSDAMEKIMAHPELISMVASVLGAPSAQTASKNEAASAETVERDEEVEVSADASSAVASDAVGASLPTEKAAPAELMTALAPLLSGLSGGKGGKKKDPDDPRSCLLRALKPYVSQGRREAIEYMIRISQISDLLKHLS